MNNNDIRTLQILEAIDNDRSPSQRELSNKLDISLGLVNSFIKRIVQKGYCKITSIPKKRVKYILTPQGAIEKTRLTYIYIQHSFKFYKKARRDLHKLFQKFVEENVRQVVFYGASDLAEIAYISLQETPIQLVAVVDDQKDDEKFLSFVVKDPDALNSLAFDKILITAMGSNEAVLENISLKNIPRNKVSQLNY